MSTKRKAEILLFMDPKYTHQKFLNTLIFELEKFAGIAQCNECDAILKAKDGVTTGLLKHLRIIHSFDVMKQKPAAQISKWCTKPEKPTESI